jgi:hypothetical protein
MFRPRRTCSGYRPISKPGEIAMNLRRWASVAALMVLGVVLGRATGSVAQDEKAKQDPDKLAVQAAEAQLKIAEMNLARMKELNSKVRGTLIAGMVEQFSDEVDLAKLELEVAKKYPGGDSYRATVERMRLALRAAEARAARALKMYETAPEITSRSDVERARQNAVIADLQLQRGLALENATPQRQLQWQMDVYSSELDRVRIYSYLLGQNRFGEFSPGL